MGFKAFGLAILAILLTVFLFISIIGLNTSQLFYPDVYESAFQKNGVYYLVSQKVPNNSAVTQTFFQEEIRANVNRLVEGSLAYVRSETDDIVFSLQIDEFRMRAYLEGVYPHLSICAPGQSPLGEEITCKPENMSSSDFVDYIISQKRVSGSNIPLSMPDLKESLTRVRFVYNAFNIFTWLSVILAIIFALATLLIRKGDGIKTIGICMMVSGVLSAIFGLIGSGIVTQFITQIRPELISSILGDVVFSVFTGLIVLGAVILIIGVVLFFLKKPVKITKRKKKKYR